MIPRRRRPLRLRIAILAMLALLWSQTALAWHAMCAAELPPAVAQVIPMDGHVGGDCHAAPPPAGDDAGLCAAHCDQSTPSPDVARIPGVPALPALVPAMTVALLPALSQARLQPDIPPPIPWKRPTAHPAAILLI